MRSKSSCEIGKHLCWKLNLKMIWMKQMSLTQLSILLSPLDWLFKIKESDGWSEWAHNKFYSKRKNKKDFYNNFPLYCIYYIHWVYTPWQTKHPWLQSEANWKISTAYCWDTFSKNPHALYPSVDVVSLVWEFELQFEIQFVTWPIEPFTLHILRNSCTDQ